MKDGTTAPAPAGRYSLKIGSFVVTALHEGIVSLERAENFVKNAPSDQVEEVFTAAGIPPGVMTITFTVFAVDTGSELVLIDTGFGENGPSTAGRLGQNLAAADYTPEDVTRVLISHFHTDHIAGLVTKDDQPVYPNARVTVPAPEWDFWMDDAQMEAAPEGLQPTFKLCRRVFGALADRVDRVEWNESPVDGITALDARGHTPGMTAYEIASEGETLLFVADVTNNPNIFARKAGWLADFDMNGDDALATRQRILGDAAKSGTHLAFYHAPFPALGKVAREGDGFIYMGRIWGAE